MFRVYCVCGNEIAVKSASAGATIPCPSCERSLSVPSLSVLRDHDERGEPAPATVAPTESLARSDGEPNVPDQMAAHYFGDVGSGGTIAPSVMENYVGLVDQTLANFLADQDESGFEVIVSCALMPEGRFLVESETMPAEPGKRFADALAECVREIPAPPVHRGPVAFFIYHRVSLGQATKTELRPFRSVADRAEKDGIENALRVTAGLSRLPSEKKSWGSRWKATWEKFWGRNDASPTPQEMHDGFSRWLDHTEMTYSEVPIKEVQARLMKDPSDVGLHIGLATKWMQEERWEDAAAAYTEAIKLHSETGFIFGRRGVAYRMAGTNEAALNDFNDAIKRSPDEPKFYSDRAQIFAELEAWSRAVEDLDQSVRLSPIDPVPLLFRAAVHIESEDHALALSDLKEAIRLDPNSGQAHAQIGWIYQETDHYDVNNAVEHLSRAIDLMSDNGATLIRRGLAYASENKFALALEDCERVIRENPDSAAAHGVRGRVLQMQGDYDDAIEACSCAIELGLDNAMVFLSRGIAYAATERFELAASDCESALALEPDNPLAFHLRGTLSMEEGELDAAMESFNKARRLAPDWSEPREHISLLHRIKENPQAAIDEQSHLVAQEPKNPSHYVNRAFARAQLGDFKQARDDYDRAIELDGENEDIYFYRGTYFVQRQEYELALSDFNRVLEIASDHDDARLQRATVLLHLRRQSEALDDFAKLIAKHPDDPSAYTGRAYAFQLIGNEKDADEDAQKLLDIIPEQSVRVNVNSLTAKIHRLRNDEQYHQALGIADEIISMAPDETVGYRLRGSLHWDLEQFVEAFDDFTRVLDIDPSEPEVLSARGQVQAEMGEWRAALDDLDMADDKSRKEGANQTLAFTLSGKSLALAGLHRFDESEKLYEESVQLCPTNPWVFYHRGMHLFRQGQLVNAKEILQRSLDLSNPPLPARKKRRVESVLNRCVPSDAGESE